MTEWLNCHNPYVQYTHEPDKTMVELIQRYGFLFDDDYWYWIPKYRGSKREVPSMVKRSPLWTYPCKSVARESGKPKPRNQRKLLDCLIPL
jgi:hypothetical protein